MVARGVDDDTWWLEVCDDGPGIPADRVERVFDRFGSGGDSAGGTGLGLAIASWVCELHGGTIIALPTPTGSTGAHLRAVLPRRARAGRPTHLRQERTVPAPSTPTNEAPSPTTRPGGRTRRARDPAATPPVVPPLAPRPAGPGAGGGALDGLWPEKGVPVQPLTVLGGAGHRRLGGADLARAQRRPGRLPHHARRRPAHVGRRAPPPRPVDDRLRRARRGARHDDDDPRRGWGRGAGRARRASSSRPPARPGPAPCCRCRSASSPGRCPALRGLPLLGRTITATSRVSKLWPILRTIGLSLVALALFGGLFASGDALFGSWADALVPDLGWDTIVARTFVLVLVAGVVAHRRLPGPQPAAGRRRHAARAPPGRPPVGVGRPRRHRRRPLRRLPRRAGHGDVGRPRVPRAAPPA